MGEGFGARTRRRRGVICCTAFALSIWPVARLDAPMWPFSWIKQFLPRSLYGRAALILLLPVVVVQLVVSSAFIQRYYEEVTQQMSQALSLDLALVLDTYVEAGVPEATRLGDALDIEIVTDAAPPERDDWVFYDFSGVFVIDTLRDELDGVVTVDLAADPRVAHIAIAAATGRPEVLIHVPRKRLSASNPHQLLVILVFTGVVMTILAYLFLRNQLRPIRRLAHAAEAFGKGRMVDYKPSGASEVRSAGQAFLDMRDRIESQIEQRTMMLSGVSHDLRTPLTRLRLGLSMLDDSADVADLTRDVTEMEMLLATFLDFARGDALDDPSSVDAAALARQVVEDAARGGGAVHYLGPEGLPGIEMRPQAVQRALGNLVGNALRYGRQARVSVALLDGAVRFSVEDDGPGIPPEQRADALRPFFRLDAARNQDRGSGVGLGLAIVNDIAQRHGGTLKLDDSADMGGLRAVLILPS